MKNIAIIGQIQQELQKSQVLNLVNKIKEEAGEDCHIFCNGSGMFSWAPQLEKQVEMLFDCGIDVLFLGEQAISRTAGRNIIGKTDFCIIRPANLSNKAPGCGIKKVKFGDDEMWLISLVDGSGKVPAVPAAFEIEKFFENKKDQLPVFININGTEFRYKEALVWKICEYSNNAIVFGNGSGFRIDSEVIESDDFLIKSIFIPDVGAVVTQNSIGGVSPNLWWKKNVEKIPINMVPEFGILKCDYCVIFFENIKKIQKILHKTVKI